MLIFGIISFLQDGRAEEMVKRGTVILEKKLESLLTCRSKCENGTGNGSGSCTEDHEVNAVKEDLCAALCARVEIYLNRTAYDPLEMDDNDTDPETSGNSDEFMASLLLRAASLSPSLSPDPLQVLASLKLSMGHREEARRHLKESIKRWRDTNKCTRQSNPTYRDKQSLSGVSHERCDVDMNDDEDDNVMDQDENDGDTRLETKSDGDEEDRDDLPSIEFRFTSAKLLLELDEEELAIEILTEINDEYDMSPDGTFKRKKTAYI